MIGDKEYIKDLIGKGDRRSHNEIAADLQLFRWTARNKGKNWRFPEDKLKEENDIRTREAESKAATAGEGE